MEEYIVRISWYDNRRNFKFKEHIFPTSSIAKVFKKRYQLEAGERIELYSRELGLVSD
ncbi:hypothetical protein NF419_02560 [Streptococcus suis]|nr:hypothetical protein [Streptococcus suis]